MSSYRIYNERELLERQTYMGPQDGRPGMAITKNYEWSGAVSNILVWRPSAGNRWIASNIVINASGESIVTLYDGTDVAGNRVFEGSIGAEQTVVIPYPVPRPANEIDGDLIITVTGGSAAGYLTVYGWESGMGLTGMTTSVSTSSSSTISSSSSSISTSTVSTSTISSSSSSISSSSSSSSTISSSSSSSSISSSSSSSSSSSISSSSSSSSTNSTSSITQTVT